MAKSLKPGTARLNATKPTSVGRKGSKAKRSSQPVKTPRGGSMTDKRWADYLAGIANGLSHREAAHSVKLTMVTVDAFLISNIAASSQLREAKLLWTRRDWPTERLDDVLEQIATGRTIRQAFKAAGISVDQIGSLYRLLLTDKVLRKLYDEARELQAESYSDDIIDIADARDFDRDAEGKINHEVINRDRLRVDARKWLSGKWAPKRFGDTKHHLHEGELNVNHAAILSGGRKRLEALHASRDGKTVDHETQTVINE